MVTDADQPDPAARTTSLVSPYDPSGSTTREDVREAIRYIPPILGQLVLAWMACDGDMRKVCEMTALAKDEADDLMRYAFNRLRDILE